VEAVQLIHALVHEIVLRHAPVVNDQPAARTQDALHLSQRPQDVRKVMRRTTACHDLKSTFAKRQPVDIGQAETYIADRAVMRQALCFCQHLRCQVRAHDAAGVRRECERRVPRAGRQVEGRLVRVRRRQLDDPRQHLRVGVRGARGVHGSALAKDFSCSLFGSFHTTFVMCCF
jgi:hypothetical protein